MLLEELMGMTQRELDDAVNVPYQRINERMNIQLRWNLYFAMQSEGEMLNAIKPVAMRSQRAERGVNILTTLS